MSCQFGLLGRDFRCFRLFGLHCALLRLQGLRFGTFGQPFGLVGLVFLWPFCASGKMGKRQEQPRSRGCGIPIAPTKLFARTSWGFITGHFGILGLAFPSFAERGLVC